MIPYEWLEQAAERIAPHVCKTPLTHDAQNGLYFKWENRQVTGSFKARGAFNKVLSLQDWERQRGLVAASAGNHGQGVALAGRLVGAPVIVFSYEHATPAKITAMRALGAEVRLVPGGYADAEQAGLAFARQNNLTWVSPYNDGQIIAGQGAVALEILAECPASAQAAWLVPVSGGGLIAGVAVALARLSPKPRLIGIQAEASAFMHALYYRGSQDSVPDLPTLADGLAGAVEDGAVTIPIVRQLVDEIILVTEAEIAQAIGHAWKVYGETIEGSGAVGLAAVLAGKAPSRPAVLIVTGGNIQPEVFEEITGERLITDH